MTGRMKSKRSPKANKRERDYHLWLIDLYTCACGCGKHSTLVHHPLTAHPEQQGRRDHEYVVPMHWECHDGLHRKGVDFEGANLRAAAFRHHGYDGGVL